MTREILGIDTETYPIKPGRQAPRVVCVQSRRAGVLIRDRALMFLIEALRGEAVIVGHNIAYDAACSIATWPELRPLWIAAYEADRVVCTLERERLIRCADGSLSFAKSLGLVELCERYKIAHDFRAGDKGSPDAWRTRYCELDGIDPAQWPADALRYAVADTVVEDLYRAQEAYAYALEDQYRQSRASFWLFCVSAYGVRTDPETIAVFAEELEREHDLCSRVLRADYAAVDQYVHEQDLPLSTIAQPILRADGSKDTKIAKARLRHVLEREGLPVPLTAKGKEQAEIGGSTLGYESLDAEATAATRDPQLVAYSRFVSITTLRSRVARLRLAADLGVPIQPRFTTLVDTGRTSCSAGEAKPGRALLSIGDQIQNPHRSPGLRECFIARPGHVLISCDWRAAELHTLAQCCIDLGLDSQLARILNSGKDVHAWFGAFLAGWSYERMHDALKGLAGPAEKKSAKRFRQGAKAANFGLPGGLGAPKFRVYSAATYGIMMGDQESQQTKALWLDTFYEMRPYFAHINALIESGQPLRQFRSGRLRGDLTYCAAANSYFQGRCADMAKDAGWRIVTSDLPARLWGFSHDEFLAEAREEIAHEAATGLAAIMEEAGRIWCPDVPVSAEPAIMRRWRKSAEPVFRDGRLIPYEDRDLDAETITAIRASTYGSHKTSWVHGIEESRVRELRA